MADLLGQSWFLPASARRVAWVPIPLFLAAIAAVWAADLRASYELPFLLLWLNFLFSTLVSLVIAYVVAKGFVAQGRPELLVLGCGVLVWGVAELLGVVAGLTSAGADRLAPNTLVTIHNSCVWVSALCQITGAVLSAHARRPLRMPGVWIAAAYTSALGVVGLVVWATLADWMPAFFVPGQGGTPVRQFVLGSAIAVFAVSAILLRAVNRSTLSLFVHWYFLGLLLLAAGLFAALAESAPGNLLSWTGRTAQFLGGAYLLAAALASERDAGVHGITLGQAQGEARYRYGVAIVIAAAAAAARLAFLPELGTRNVFLTFYPAVILAALYGGLGPGLLAAVVSALLADYFWIEPYGFGISHPGD
jgi:hypothetical protein